MYKKFLSLAPAYLFLVLFLACSSQKKLATTSGAATATNSNSNFPPDEVARIENILASDEMRGRKTGTPEIDKAADFIADEFKKAGLVPLHGNSFLQEFILLKPQLKYLGYASTGEIIDKKNIVVATSQAELTIDEKSGYQLQTIKADDNLFARATEFITSKQNNLVLVDTSMRKIFFRLSFLNRQIFQSPYSTVFMLANHLPASFQLKATHGFGETRFKNVVGQLPGKGNTTEQVIFSGHYDHLGISASTSGDTIYNGANDDAAGTTAVIMLAKHFKQLDNNQRTLIFAAFTAEEIGGFGSRYFSQQSNPNKVMAMFNIEMIGTESKWGKNSAYITGFDKTNMGTILQNNLKGSKFSFYPDPYPEEQLFYRSDNATLAQLGVPAHTISTSKMDNEPNYHKVSDEVSTLDLNNMAQIIQAIAESSKSIISGKDTPTRVRE